MNPKTHLKTIKPLTNLLTKGTMIYYITGNHNDVFDVTMEPSKWLARLGGKGYDLLILLNMLVNMIRNFFGYGRISVSKKVKDSVKSALEYRKGKWLVYRYYEDPEMKKDEEIQSSLNLIWQT